MTKGEAKVLETGAMFVIINSICREKLKLIMTKGEAKVLETGAMFVSSKSDRKLNLATPIEETVVIPKIENSSLKSNVDIRFARLKKSLRKRSVSIL